VKLLLDENLSPRLMEALSDLYPGSEHVHGCGLGGKEDDAVWNYAKANGSDFAERSVLDRNPPKIIWMRTGNCSTAEIEVLLRSANQIIRNFIQADQETCFLLTRQR
jgi:predicted nuclease of predicted toxin-antitoxin system